MDETTTATSGRAASPSSGDGQLRQGADAEAPSRPESCDSRSGVERLDGGEPSRTLRCCCRVRITGYSPMSTLTQGPSPKLLTALTPTPWSAATPPLRVSR